MNAFSREKIALLVFCLLMVIGAGTLAFYLFAGHSWNYAATRLDDSFGNMDGYAVLVFEGTVDPEEAVAKQAAEAEADPEGTASESFPGLLSEGEGEDESEVDGDALEQPQEGNEAEGAAEDDADASAVANADADESAIADADGDADPDATADIDDASSSTTFKLPFSSLTTTKSDPVTAELVGKDYEEKGASVFVLDSANVDHYAEGAIMQRGSHRIGVMSVSSPRSTASLERQVTYFKENKVDFIVALVSNGSYLTGVPGVDIVIATDGDGSLTLGQTVNGAFRVYAPEVGSVGAVLISPSSVVSAKVIDEL